MAKIIFDVAKAADVYGHCVSTVDSAFTDTIRKGINYNNVTPRHIALNNTCGTAFTIEAGTLISDNGFTISVENVNVAANSTTNVPLIYNGAYTGAASQLTGNFSLNQGQTVLPYIITITEVNQPPVSENNVLRLGNRQNKTITKTDLIYSDPDNDPITHVKFTGDVSRLYTDSNMLVPYTSGTELPIEFTLYYKAPDVDDESTYNVNYSVKAGNDWSS